MPNTSKTIQQLNLEDDFLFAKVMNNQSASPQILSDLSSVFTKKVGDFFEIGV